MKNLLLLFSIFVFFGTGCSRVHFGYPKKTALELLQGTWKACNDTGGSSSSSVVFTFANNVVSETISDFDQIGCTGNETIVLQFTADVVIETEEGKSLHFPGATDVTLTPDIDLFGCGLGVPAYTFIKFLNSNFNAFGPSDQNPSCDPNTRGTNVSSTLIFNKQ